MQLKATIEIEVSEYVDLDTLRAKQKQPGYAPRHGKYDEDLPYVEPTEEEFQRLVAEGRQYILDSNIRDWLWAGKAEDISELTVTRCFTEAVIGYIANLYA